MIIFRIQEKDGAIGGPKWRFTEGLPGPGGHPPTRITDKFLNDVQEELINLLSGGKLLPSESNQNQVVEAVAVVAGFQVDYKTVQKIIVGPGGHFDHLSRAVSAATPGTSILVTADSELALPIKIDKEFIAITFRWGTKLIRGPSMTQDYLFEVSADGFLLEGLNTEGFKNFVKFSQPPPRFAFIRNSTLKGGTAPTIGGTPPYLDLATVVLY